MIFVIGFGGVKPLKQGIFCLSPAKVTIIADFRLLNEDKFFFRRV